MKVSDLGAGHLICKDKSEEPDPRLKRNALTRMRALADYLRENTESL
jgi:hypothetical protein